MDDGTIRCSDCGTHFSLGPGGAGGSTDGMACPECGGKRMFMEQPSPTQSDGTLRDMVDSDTQIDQGGNPLGEGTIMGVDGERNQFVRDNFMHSNIAPWPVNHNHSMKQSMMDRPATFNTEPYIPWQYDEKTLEMARHQAGIWDTVKDIGTGIATHPLADALAVGGGAAALTGVGDLGPAEAMEAGAAADLGGAAAGAGATAGEDAAESEVAKETGSAGGGMLKNLGQGVGGQFVKGVGEEAAKGIGGLMKGALGMGSGGGLGAPSPTPGLIQTGSTKDIPMILVADFETYDSVPSLDSQDDGQHGFDQKEFSDGDRSPSNFENPNMEDSGAMGEDNARSDSAFQTGFSSNSPGIERAHMIMPLLMHYYHSNESGERDPLVRGLHEALEQENPGYLTRSDPAATQMMIDRHRNPSPIGVHAGVNMQQLPGGAPTTGTLPGQAPVNSIPQPQMATGTCPNCGGVLGPDGSCPQCGNGNNATMVPPTPLGGAGVAMAGIAAHLGASYRIPCEHCGNDELRDMPYENGGYLQCTACGRPQHARPTDVQTEAPAQSVDPWMDNEPGSLTFPEHWARTANHQGPVTPEQIAAVQEILINTGRAEECPNVPLHPEQYAKEMAEIQNQPNIAPQIDPSQLQQTPPPAMPQAPGGMPVTDPSQPGGGGGQPMQPMSSTHKADANTMVPRCPNCGSGSTSVDAPGEPSDGESEKGICHACQTIFDPTKEASTKIADANTMTPRCPRCDSGSTRVHAPGDPTTETDEPQGFCPSCGLIFDASDPKVSSVSLVFAGEVEVANPMLQRDEPHMKWADVQGQDLMPGQTYELHSSAFSVPTEIRIMNVKPDGLDVQLTGGVGNATGQPDFKISRQEAQLEKYEFVPIGDAPHSVEPDTTPGISPEQVPPIETTDETPEVTPHTQSSVEDTSCQKCGSVAVDTRMLSPEITAHDCVRCANHWETKDEDPGTTASVDLSWIRESDNDDIFSDRHQAMMEVGSGSRNLADIAAKDNRLQEIKARLDANEKLAGKYFSQSEKRALIDETGTARNLEDLELSGTHYKTPADWTGKANGANVDDDHFALGL